MVKKSKEILPGASYRSHFPNVKLDNRKNYFYGRCQNTSLLNDMGIIVAEKKMDDGPNLYIIEKKQ